MDELDRRLAALMTCPDRAVDEKFAQRVKRAIVADERLRIARRRAWSKFRVEAAATGAATAVFILLGRLPTSAEGAVPVSSPAGVGLLLLGLWVAVTLRPSGRSRGLNPH